MLVFRIASRAYASDLQGTGCLYSGGRWHYKGTQIVYTSEHVSLSKLEILANSPFIPKSQTLVTIEIPDEASILDVGKEPLPDNWWQFPYPDALANITEQWIGQGKFWIMKVPSAHSFNEFNYLLNPAHSDHKLAKVIRIEDIYFDKRLK
ncbi:RES family NAD+ phosphorylase [Dyadobacter chenwenxiniae]|uniref:RES family NAD+ phosphorylase n=1 Tax=Dyadobacter chenwenxiniae TaxID=2906456 RepID=A0A9X1PS32_9BACT|nr:RES family NAD+ phosphorylase [Dyadobacter chenwenxiniae]MCF0064056.1 RES family NAD+ phosphorylase [Dyadobacter chenwenxiniae]UON82784.1 RES family NAD+ phosphorylase [Dyadobacter chenwenxiniae]